MIAKETNQNSTEILQKPQAKAKWFITYQSKPYKEKLIHVEAKVGKPFFLSIVPHPRLISLNNEGHYLKILSQT